MVGGERQHHGVRVALARDRGRRRDRGPGIPSHRFDHHGRLDADFFGLAAGKEMKIRPSNDDRRGEHRIAHPQQGLLVGRAVANQRQELLGQSVTGDRP